MKKILPYHQELFLMKSTGLKLISFLMIILLGLSPSLSWGQGSGKTVKGTLIDGRPFTEDGKAIAALQAEEQYKIYTKWI